MPKPVDTVGLSVGDAWVVRWESPPELLPPELSPLLLELPPELEELDDSEDEDEDEDDEEDDGDETWAGVGDGWYTSAV